jgi:CBS domain-containing protein
MQTEIRQFLGRMPHFAMLPDDELDKVAEQAKPQTFEKGVVIAEQGKTHIHHIYVLKKGQLSLYEEKNGKQELGGYIKYGEVFGGITLLMSAGVSLRTVRVDEQTETFTIPRDMFLDLCARYKGFHEFFLENFSKHIFDPALSTIISSGQARLFLSGTAPFSFLPEEAIEEAANNLSMVSYPKGTVLFVQGRTRVGYLYIVQKGSVERYFEQDGHKAMREIMGEGDLYGGISMLVNDGLSVRTLEVIEDTYFYLLPNKIFLRYCQDFEAFSEFFTDTFGKRMLNRSYAAIIARASTPVQEDHQIFNQPVGRFYNAATVFGESSFTIRQAALKMREEDSTYLVIPASKHHAAGIITDRDLARKVIANDYDINRPVVEIMSTPLRTVSHQTPVLGALMAMMQYDIKHLAVSGSDQQIIGMITNRELLSAQGQSPLFMLRHIVRAEGLEDIIYQHQRLADLVKSLIGSGAKARHINRMITMVSDAVLKKIMGFALAQMGTPPARFVFMILGSEGRGEQTLKTDQDNAIVFEDVPSAELDKVSDFFLELGKNVCGMLDRVGYTYCVGDIMAQNPKLCQPLSVWKEYFTQWIHAAEAEDLLQASIFFDFRGGYGDMRLIDALREHLMGSIGSWSGFLRHMTENALHFKPPLGFFNNFVVESKGEHRNAFDIKSAMMPIVDFARVYALKNGIETTNTLERLYQLTAKKVLSQEEHDELDRAYSFLMQLRLVRQVTAVIDQKSKPDNYINPKKLTRIEQTTLKEIFKRIDKFQAKMNFDFIGIA